MSSSGRARRRAGERGQTTSEYLVLMGTATAIAVLVSSTLGFSLRMALRTVAERMLSVITGHP